MDEQIQKRVDETWKEKAKDKTTHIPSSEQETRNIPEPNFKLFVTSLGMQAWIALGAIPNPMTEKTEEDLNQAKFLIDSLEMLQNKTKGNLDQEETEMLEGVLYELRLSFVNKTTKG